MFYSALQTLLTIVLTNAQSWKQKRSRLIGYRWFWRGTGALVVALCMLVWMPTPVQTPPLLSRPVKPADHGVFTAIPSTAGRDKRNFEKKASRGRAGPQQRARNTDEVEKAAAKRAVKKSQNVEFFEFYRDPDHVDRHELREYWLPGSEALQDIMICLNHLRVMGWHYGIGSKLIRFEFRYVKIYGDHAEVGTTEHWLLPMCHSDGSPVEERNADQGPYTVDYGLTKVKGQWLVATTTTPYAHKQSTQ